MTGQKKKVQPAQQPETKQELLLFFFPPSLVFGLHVPPSAPTTWRAADTGGSTDKHAHKSLYLHKAPPAITGGKRGEPSTVLKQQVSGEWLFLRAAPEKGSVQTSGNSQRCQLRRGKTAARSVVMLSKKMSNLPVRKT